MRRSGSLSVTTATPSLISSSTRSHPCSSCSSDDRRRMAEELLDVTLVPVGGRVVADGAAQPKRLDERLHGSGRRVLVLEPGALEAAVVDATAVLQQRQQLGRQVEHRTAAAGAAKQAHAERRERQQCACRRSPPPPTTGVARRRRRCRSPGPRGRARRGSSERRLPRARTGGEGRSRTATAPRATRAPSKRA